MVGRLNGNHNYPKDRKPPIKHNKKRPTNLLYKNTAKKRRMKEWMIALLTYAPVNSTLYTLSYGNSIRNRYQYMDVFVIHDKVLLKISSYIADVMRIKTLGAHFKFRAENILAVMTRKEHEYYSHDDVLELEQETIKKLNLKMFNNENGYKHISILAMSEYEKREKTTDVIIEEAEQIIEPKKKSYILRAPIDNS